VRADIFLGEVGDACVFQALTEHLALKREPIADVAAPVELDGAQFQQVLAET
jgi:hypothetical protein